MAGAERGCRPDLCLRVTAIVFMVFSLIFICLALGTDFWFSDQQVYHAIPNEKALQSFCYDQNVDGCKSGVFSNPDNFKDCKKEDCKNLRGKGSFDTKYRYQVSWGVHSYCYLQMWRQGASWNTDNNGWRCQPWRQITSPYGSTDSSSIWGSLRILGDSTTSNCQTTGTGCSGDESKQFENAHYCMQAALNSMALEILSVILVFVALILLSMLLCCFMPTGHFFLVCHLCWFMLLLALLFQIVAPNLMTGMCMDIKDDINVQHHTASPTDEITSSTPLSNSFGTLGTQTAGAYYPTTPSTVTVPTYATPASTNICYYWENSPEDDTPSFQFNVGFGHSFVFANLGSTFTFLALIFYLVWLCCRPFNESAPFIVQHPEFHPVGTGPKWPVGPNGPRAPGFQREHPTLGGLTGANPTTLGFQINPGTNKYNHLNPYNL